MKAVVASLATAAVLVGAAYAGNVTPLQLSKLNTRVTHLQSQVSTLSATLECVRKFTNTQTYVPYLAETWGGGGDVWGTKSGTATLYTVPNIADGLAGTGYLVTSQAQQTQC